MASTELVDRASGDGARSGANFALGLGLGIAVWFCTSALVTVFAVRAKEACSSEIGSVSQVGTTELLLPCDLVGWLAGSTTVGALLILGLAMVCGAWRRWSTSLVAIASVVGLQALCLAGLNATHLM